MKGVRFLGRINTAIILTILYFAVLPFFFLVSLVKKNNLSSGSQWRVKSPEDPKSHEFQF